MKKFSAFNGFFTHCPNIFAQNTTPNFTNTSDDNLNFTQNTTNPSNLESFDNTNMSNQQTNSQVDNLTSNSESSQKNFEPPLHYPQTEDYFSQFMPKTKDNSTSENQSNQNNVNSKKYNKVNDSSVNKSNTSSSVQFDNSVNNAQNSNNSEQISHMQDTTKNEPLSIKAKSLFKCMQDHDYILRNINN